MSSTIEVDHNGYQIRYAENEDVWRCWDLNLDAKTLSALKAKINKLDADARRVDNLPVIRIGSYAVEGEAVIILAADDKSCWTFGVDRWGKKNKREKTSYSGLALDTPATRQLVARWQELSAEARRASEAAKGALEAIPRMTAADIAKAPSE